MGNGKLDVLRKKKDDYHFYYNAVYFDCYEDPNRFKKFSKQKDIMEYKNKEKNKNSVKE